MEVIHFGFDYAMYILNSENTGYASSKLFVTNGMVKSKLDRIRKKSGINITGWSRPSGPLFLSGRTGTENFVPFRTPAGHPITYHMIFLTVSSANSNQKNVYFWSLSAVSIGYLSSRQNRITTSQAETSRHIVVPSPRSS